MREKIDKSRFVRYNEACEIYGMGMTKLKETVKAAGAKHKLNHMVLISLDKMDAYIETLLQVN